MTFSGTHIFLRFEIYGEKNTAQILTFLLCVNVWVPCKHDFLAWHNSSSCFMADGEEISHFTT